MNTLQTIICLLALIATGLSVYILARTVRKQSEGFRRRRRQDEDMAAEDDVPLEDEEDLEAEEDEVQNVEGPSWDKTTKCMSDNASYFIGILVVICIIGVVIHFSQSGMGRPTFSQGMIPQAMPMMSQMPQAMPQMPQIPSAMPQLSPYGYRM
jgi:hypothetical protein